MQNEIWDKKFVVKSVGKTQKIVVKNVNTVKSSLYILAGRDIIL